MVYLIAVCGTQLVDNFTRSQFYWEWGNDGRTVSVGVTSPFAHPEAL